MNAIHEQDVYTNNLKELTGNDDDDTLLLERTRPKLKKPPLYKVILLNDDYTPMEFVVEILETFFRMNREQATHVMLTVHTQGKGVCGIFTRDIAETKAAQVNQVFRPGIIQRSEFIRNYTDRRPPRPERRGGNASCPAIRE